MLKRAPLLFAILYFFISFQGKSQVNLNMGLVASYPFNGNANDASGNNHHGTLVNGITLTSDRFGNANSAFRFDGIDDYIKIVDDGAFSTPQFSLVVWFQSESNALQNLIAKRDYATMAGTGGAQYQMFINYPPYPGIGSNIVGNNSTCSSIASSSYLNTGNNVCSNKWICGVITFDGNRHKLYINGELKRDELTGFTALLSCKSELRFGNWFQAELITFKGVMDDIRWYNRALNQQEVEALFDGFLSATPVLKVTDVVVPCGGGSADLTSPNVTAGSDAGLSYSYWRDAAATQSVSVPNAVPTSGTYYIKANAGSNCSVIKPVVVKASSLPNVIINNPSACTPENVDLTSAAITAGSDPDLVFSYWRDIGTTSAITLPEAKAIDKNGTYYIRATNTASCSRVIPVTVTIKTPPTLSVSNPSALCAPATINLSSSISSPTTGITISYWKDAITSIPLSDIEAASISTSGTYFVKADNGGCFATKSVQVIVNSQPTLTISNPLPVCEPSFIDLTDPSLKVGSESGLSFSYYLNNTATTLVPNPKSVSSGTYFIKGTGGNGCSSIKPVTVVVVSKPTFTLTPLEKNLCFGEMVMMNGDGGDLYEWFIKSNPVIASTSHQYSFKPAVTDSVFVVITSSTCKIKDTLGGLIRVNDLPSVTISKSNDIDCQKPTAQLKATGGISFQWSPNTFIDNYLSSAPLVYPLEDTWYKVRVTDANNCINEESILIQSKLGAGGGKFFVSNAFSPNGDGKNDCFGVTYWPVVKEFELSVFDRWGNRVFYTTDVSSCWDGTYKRKLQPLGTYIYQIKAISPCSEGPIFIKGHINLIR